MTSSRPSINTDNSAGQAPTLDANEWLGVQRRHPSTAPTSSNPQDLGQFVRQLGPEEPWDGIAMFHAPPSSAEHWPGQRQYQSQYQPQDQLHHAGAYAGYQQQHQHQQDYLSQQHTSTRADQGIRPSEQQREGSSREKSRRGGKSKKDSQSKSSRK